MTLQTETEESLKTLLRVIWDSADWRRIAGPKRSKYDVYAHKIKAAGHQQSVSTFMEKLCHSLGLQSVRVDTSLIRRLESDCQAVLKAVRKETIYYMLLAVEGGE